MVSEKANVNVQISPEPALPLDKQLSALIRKRNPLAVRLECDQTGTLSIDKDKHPDIYEWLVNG